MTRKMKSLVALLLVAAMQMAMVFGASAADLDVTEIGIGIDEEGEIDLQYIGSCPYGDKHQMRGKGTGLAYYGSAGSTDLRISGTASQCQNCDLVLITQNNPFMVGVTWGKYATWNPGYQVNSGVVKMYTTSFSTANSLNDPYVQGFDFGR